MSGRQVGLHLSSWLALGSAWEEGFVRSFPPGMLTFCDKGYGALPSLMWCTPDTEFTWVENQPMKKQVFSLALWMGGGYTSPLWSLN